MAEADEDTKKALNRIDDAIGNLWEIMEEKDYTPDKPADLRVFLQQVCTERLIQEFEDESSAPGSEDRAMSRDDNLSTDPGTAS